MGRGRVRDIHINIWPQIPQREKRRAKIINEWEERRKTSTSKTNQNWSAMSNPLLILVVSATDWFSEFFFPGTRYIPQHGGTMVLILMYVCVFTLNGSSTRRHPAHLLTAASVLILHPTAAVERCKLLPISVVTNYDAAEPTANTAVYYSSSR